MPKGVYCLLVLETIVSRKTEWLSVCRHTAVVVVAMIAAWIVFRHFRFAVAFVGIGLVAVLFAIHAGRERSRSVAVAVSTVFFTLALADLLLHLGDKERKTSIEPPPGWKTRLDPQLGRLVSKSGAFRLVERQVSDGSVVYDVTYTIDEHGHRATPGGDPGSDTYLFFGASFTFGLGVEDEENLPARFSQANAFQYSVVNFAHSGHGPNLMLANLDFEREKPVIGGDVRHAFYLLIDSHIDRSVGLRRWNIHDARYEIDADGTPVHRGIFQDVPLMRLLRWADIQGGLAGLLRNAALPWLFPMDRRVDLTAAMIARSAELLDSRYGVELTTIIWWERTDRLMALAELLEGRGLEVVWIQDLGVDPADPAMKILPVSRITRRPAAYQRAGPALANWERQRNVN